ncbi:zinc ribbon domain-containing protein [Kribbella sp. NBC_00709]|uniref:zinc ribbon domain-containing protein n=1 Tax=Kribbella sp. NBC_00709 TaxID=2975972 RepID=UPI003FA52432
MCATAMSSELERRKRKAGGEAGWSSVDRRRVSKKRVYRLRGRIKCGICARKMEGAARRADTIYYRCNARTLLPGSATATAHPQQIYLREDVITPPIHRWIGSLFDPMHRGDTITALLDADDSGDEQLSTLNGCRIG